MSDISHFDHDLADELTRIVGGVMSVDDVTYTPVSGITVRFRGHLLMDSAEAFDLLEERFRPLGHIPIFRKEADRDVVLALEGSFNARPRPIWPNVLLLVLTVISLLMVGAEIELAHREVEVESITILLTHLWMGWPYALSVLLILGAHELGHYFAAKRHRVPATLPYFIPLPPPFSLFGTMGAFINLRAPMRNRRAMLDIGVAGPLAGMVFAVPILFIGLATSPVLPLPTDTPYLVEGNSILYAVAKFLIFGRWLPSGGADVFINQIAQAGWTGLLVTGLNLIPLGQLDGGHVIYTLLGERARKLYWPVMGVLAVMAILVSDAWMIWLAILLIFGRSYAVPLDMITPLDGRRRMIGIMAMVLFILVFVPDPIRLVEPVATVRDQVFMLIRTLP